MPKIYRRMPLLKCHFNKSAQNFIETAFQHGCSPLDLLHIYRTFFPRNTWSATSVNWEINTEKWEKIRLDMAKIFLSCTLYRGASQTIQYPWRKLKLTLKPNSNESRKARFERAPSLLFSYIICDHSTNSCFTNTLEATTDIHTISKR